MLGTIFQHQHIWGNEYDIRSAVFQWKRALIVEENIRKLVPKHRQSPILHQDLAETYKGAGRPNESFDEYLLAAQGFRDQSNRRAAVRKP
jgi:hypothetical protein